ncbi:MAG TPA: hypothetical protein ENJ64_04000, partial [Thiotrichales bacterium]|nr:hypothetical protein [Thiotrichales bacterium]
MKHRSDAIDLLKYYFISLVALTLSGLIFKGLFVFYNHALFSSLDTTDIFYALFWGIRFDLAAAAFFSFISCLVLWLFNLFRVRRNPAMLLLLAMLLLQMTLQIGDTMYFAEAGRHVSYEMRDVFTDAGGLLKTALTNHILFILLSYLVGAVVIAVVLGVTVKYLVSANKLRPLSVFRFHHGVKLIAILLLTVLLLRGGLGGVPQSILHAFKIGDPQQAVITMNGAYSIVYGAIKSGKDIQQLAIVLPKGTDETAIMQSLYP